MTIYTEKCKIRNAMAKVGSGYLKPWANLNVSENDLEKTFIFKREARGMNEVLNAIAACGYSVVPTEGCNALQLAQDVAKEIEEPC